MMPQTIRSEIEGEYCAEAAEDLENTGLLPLMVMSIQFIVVNTKEIYFAKTRIQRVFLSSHEKLNVIVHLIRIH